MRDQAKQQRKAMGRPAKQTVEYFPHYVHHGKTLFILEQRWGVNGYAGFYKLLEILADEPGHYYDARKTDKWEFLVAKMGVSAPEILQKLSDLDIIDSALWSVRVIWMESFVSSVKEAYRKRDSKAPTIPPMALFLPQETGENPSFRAGNPPDGDVDGVSGDGNPQRREEKNKEKKRKDIMSDVDAIRLAELLFSQILKQQPDSKLQALNNGRRAETVNRWAEDIEKLKRIDKRHPERIEQVIIWATADSFWKGNILSGLKLREKWDTLVAQMDRMAGNDAYDW